MKILFDYQIFFLQKKGGISTYFDSLTSRLNEENYFIKIVSPFFISEILEKKKYIIGNKISTIPKFSTKILSHINDLVFEYYVKKYRPQVIHHTYYNKIYNFNKTKKILTVYDLIHEQLYNIKNKKKSLESADRIICISKNTQKELLDHYKISKEKTSVIYLASKFKYDVSCKNLEPQDPYLLYVGDRSRYKNFYNFIKSIAISALLKNKIKIICFGIYPFTTNELELFLNEGFLPGNIIFISGNDNVLKKLYQNSTALVYPSLYEGFGLPIIEAMSLGCPVVCSNTSSIPEIAGDATNYFNPNDVENMKNSIEEVVFSSSKRKNLIEKGFIQSKKFSWDSCFLETLKIYKSIL